MTLFREWEAAIATASLVPMEPDDQEYNARMDVANEIEKRMRPLPSTSAQDFAAKVVAYTNYGDFTMDVDCEIISDARALLLSTASDSTVLS